jgi:hypothetical protein
MPEVYIPVLKELEEFGVHFIEEDVVIYYLLKKGQNQCDFTLL